MFRRKDEGAPDAATDAPAVTPTASEVQVPPAPQGQNDAASTPVYGSSTGTASYSSGSGQSSSTAPASTSFGSAPASNASGSGNAYTSPYRAPGMASAGSNSGTGSSTSGSNVTELSGRSGTSARFGENRPNTGSTAMEKTATKSAGKNRILTVGNDILMKGEINSCDRIVIEGAVDATLKEVHTMEIAESGSFKGIAEVEEAEISGTVEGDLTVRGRLIIYSTGKVSGKISYGEIEIERGGQLTGEIKTVGTAVASSSKAAA